MFRATPAPTRMHPFEGWPSLVSARVLRTTSPRGVAPPVKEDCAPTGMYTGDACDQRCDVGFVSRECHARAKLPGTCAASLRNDDTIARSRSICGGGAEAAFRALMRWAITLSSVCYFRIRIRDSRPGYATVLGAQSREARAHNRAPRAMDPIRYTLRFPSPHTHYVEVRAEVPTCGRDEVELMMAVWTPGSYLIRDRRAARGERGRDWNGRCGIGRPQDSQESMDDLHRRRRRDHRDLPRDDAVRCPFEQTGLNQRLR